MVRDYPFTILVTADLRATHMPCLIDDDSVTGLTLIGHVAKADPVAESLDGPLLAIFHGPHGYVSASWYAGETIPTWNHLTLHVRALRTSPGTSAPGSWPDWSTTRPTPTRRSPS